MKKPKSNQAYKAYLTYSGLAFQMIAVLGLFLWAGMSLDKYLSLKFPAFTVSLSLMAIIGVMILVIKSLPKY